MNTTPRGRSLRLVANLLGAVLLLVGLAACSSDDDAADGGTDASVPAPEVEEGAFPVTIEHRFGETEITERPERIVVAGLVEQDALLALGEVPVATVEWFGEWDGAIWPWAQDELAALGGALPHALPAEATPSTAEEILALEPDLILSVYGGLTQETYDVLSQIAPTVAQPDDVVDYGVSWQDLTRTVGLAVGQPERAVELVEEVEAQVAEVRAVHPELEGATGVVATPYEGIFVYGPEDARGRILTDLGLRLPDGLVEATGAEFGGGLSEERADLLDVDVIVWLDPDEAEGVLGGPAYEALGLDDEGREVFLDSYTEDGLGGATSFVTVLSVPYLLDALVPMLVAAVDGDPATAVPSQAEATAT